MTITDRYFIGDVKLRWCTRVDDNITIGRVLTITWDVLKKELREQFLSCSVSWLARESLKKLKQMGYVRDCMKQFSSLMLVIKNMFEDEKLFKFMRGLQGWCRWSCEGKG